MRCAAISPSSAWSRRSARLAVLGAVEDARIPPLARAVLQTLADHLRDLEAEIAGLDRRLVALTRTDPVCRLWAEVPGVGPVVATAFAATVPDAGAFRSGRHLAAWLGLVPREHASGGKVRQLGVSKRGAAYLAPPARPRRPGAGVAQSWPDRRPAVGLVDALLTRRPFNVVVVAVANQLARPSGPC